jgi:hypothetical protein
MPDVHDNAQNLDFALNEITSTFWTDRLGRRRMSWLGIESAFTMKLTDFESRFDFRLAEQESVFAESLVDKENRFQQFLGDSGYVFLGDYEDGPFQFSARNQYIRFQNQFYRLNKSTDTGFTTTGTDETSFANDVTHLVLMDGDTLRQNLGSDDGLKWVGKCATLSALRTVEPTYSGQSITLRHAVSGGHEINCSLWYDADDLATADDGYSVFVTAGGLAGRLMSPEGLIYDLLGFFLITPI